MISVVICSVNRELRNKLVENIRATIGGGTPFEFIVIDNAEAGLSIAAAYNRGAAQAQYPYLLFMHEDAGFITDGWGEEITRKLAEPDCGVIGFAGTRGLLNVPGCWNMVPQFCVASYVECGDRIDINTNPESPFREVVAVDGYAMFCRRDAWEKAPFDEDAIKGFHCYDIDFSLGIGVDHTNYVCCNIETFHNSRGKFDRKWVEATLGIYKSKWGRMLPRLASDMALTPSEVSGLEERACFRFMKAMRENGVRDAEVKKRFMKYPLTPKHVGHLLKYMVK